MLDLTRFAEIKPTDLLDDPNLMLEYMETAYQIYLDGQETRNLLEKALSREENYQSTIAKQESQIRNLTEMVEKLNGSDVILKKNEELICENRRLKELESKTRKECEKTVQACEREKNEAICKAQSEKEKYENANSRLSEIIENRARNIVSEKIFDLKSKAKEAEARRNRYFDGVRARYYELLLGSLFLNMVLVIFGLTRTKAFTQDTLSFFSGVGGIYQSVIEFCNGKEIWQIILVALLTIAVTAGLIILMIWLLQFMLKGVWDEYMMGFIMLLQGGLIFYGDLIRRDLPINLFLLDILAMVGYMVVVKYVRIEDGDLKKRILVDLISGVLIIAVVAGGIGVIWMMIR